jgi:hypothetical protein
MPHKYVNFRTFEILTVFDFLNFGLTLGKDYKAKMFQMKVGWGWGKFAGGSEIFSVSQDLYHGGKRRGVTSV